MHNDQSFDTSQQNNSRGTPAPRDDEATPVKEIRSQHARTRNVSIDVANGPVLLADVNSGRMGLIITNNSLQSNLVIVCNDEKPGQNSTNEVTSIVPPSGEWRVPGQYTGRIWGYWQGIMGVINGSDWVLQSQPAAGTVATATKAAVAGVRHRLISLTAALFTQTTALNTSIVVRDGLSGVGAILFSYSIRQPITATLNLPSIAIGNGILGTAGNAMTIEYAGNSADGIESISGTGVDQSTTIFGTEVACVTEFA